MPIAKGSAGCTLPGRGRRVVGAGGGLVLILLLLMALPGASADSPSPLAPEALAEEEGTTAQDAGNDAGQGVFRQATAWMLVTQRELHRELSHGLRDLRREGSAVGALGLIMVSFLYGIFHAAGPGHGKAVISTYLLTHPSRLRTGLLLSFAASMLQGITAILLVFGLVKLAGWLNRDAMQQVGVVEQVSFALVAGLGALLCIRAGRRLWRRISPGLAAESVENVSQPAVQPTSLNRGMSFRPLPARDSGIYSLTPSRSAMADPGCGCGHPHHVAPPAITDTGSHWPMVAAVAAVGSRPCTGAVLVLAAANLLGLWAVGVLSVMAMALGTALAICILATIAVQARGWAARLAGRMGDNRWAWAGDAVSLTGGLLILLAGTGLLVAAAGSPPPALYRL